MVPAVTRALDILELFLTRGPELSSAEIIELTGIPKTSAHSIINTLVEREYLVRFGEYQPHRFRLGIRAFELGSVSFSGRDVATVGQSIAEDLSARFDETVQIGVLNGTDVIPVVKVDGQQSIQLVSKVGKRTPAHCTALGKSLLAWLPETALEALYPSGSELEQLTERSITSVSELHEHLKEVRQAGASREFCESNESAVCVASPIRDSSGRVVAAISMSVPVVRWSTDAEVEWAARVHEHALRISRELGFNTI